MLSKIWFGKSSRRNWVKNKKRKRLSKPRKTNEKFREKNRRNKPDANAIETWKRWKVKIIELNSKIIRRKWKNESISIEIK